MLADYRLTVSDLLLDGFTADWRAWARRAGRRRAQPGARLAGEPPRPLRRQRHPRDRGHRDTTRARGRRRPLHVAGRRLVSAEAATWLGEHFRTTLAEVRAAADRFFVAGVNHIVYHGTAYSPRSDAVARMAVLRIRRVQFAQPMVEGLSAR